MNLVFENLNTYKTATTRLLPKHPDATILTATELYEYINPLKVLPARAAMNPMMLEKRVTTYKETSKLIHDYVLKLGENICREINPSYALSSIDKIKSHPENFDALFLVNDITKPFQKRTQQTDDYIEDLQSHVIGFVIVELGECKMKPKVISINLICTQKGVAGAGKILLGAVLYCIGSQSKLEKECVLELASGYKNISGFLTYSKLGFVPNLDLFKIDGTCFGATTNLPMSVDLTKHTPDVILGYVTGLRQLDIQDATFRILSLKSDPDKPDEKFEELKNIYIGYQQILMKSRFYQNSHFMQFITDVLYGSGNLGLVLDKLEKDVGKYKYIDDMDNLFKEEIQSLQETLLQLPKQITYNVSPLPDDKFKVCTGGGVCEIIETDALAGYLTTLRGGTRKKGLRKPKKIKNTKKYK